MLKALKTSRDQVMLLHADGISCSQSGGLQGFHAMQIATIMLFTKALEGIARPTNGETLEQVFGDPRRQLISKFLNSICIEGSVHECYGLRLYSIDHIDLLEEQKQVRSTREIITLRSSGRGKSVIWYSKL